VFEVEEEVRLDEGEAFAETLARAFNFLLLVEFDCETPTVIC